MKKFIFVFISAKAMILAGELQFKQLQKRCLKKLLNKKVPQISNLCYKYFFVLPMVTKMFVAWSSVRNCLVHLVLSATYQVTL